SVPTSSTAGATRRWGAPGATSMRRRSDARRPGRTRRKATRRPRPTSGGTGTISTRPSSRLTGDGARRWTPRGAVKPDPKTRFGDGADRPHAGVAEVAEAAAFLASHRPSGMTGTVANLAGAEVID